MRSGTSVVVNSLIDGARIRGYYEMNVGPLMQRLVDIVDEHFANFSKEYLDAKDFHLIGHLEPEALKTVIRNYFATFFQAKLGSGRWVGKSPDSYENAPMTRASRAMAEMFPKAKFIYCLRRGIENVMSRQRKFPDIPFGYHCQSWANTVQEWFKVKPMLGTRAFEVRQRDVAIHPEKVAADLARFLDLTDEQREGILGVFVGPRHEQIHLAQEHRELALKDTPWDENHRNDFILFCRNAMEAAGFSLDGRVEGAGVPVRLFFPTVREAVRTRNVHPEWGFTEIDARTFQIHPNEVGAPPAEVRWPFIALRGATRFSAGLSLGHRESGPVWFEMRVERSDDGEVIVSNRRELADVLRWDQCEMSFAPLSGIFDVVISTQMSPTAASSDFAWARIRDAHLR